LQRNRATLPQESLKIAAIPQVLPSNRTGESVPSNPAGKFSGAFLWRAHVQSGFSDSLRRMQCESQTDHSAKRLDFVSIRECRLSQNTFVGISVGPTIRKSPPFRVVGYFDLIAPMMRK